MAEHQPALRPASPTATGNRYDRLEWAGAFGDLGTLVPFALALAFLNSRRLPAMFLLLALGVGVSLAAHPGLAAELAQGFGFRPPALGLGGLTWPEFARGALVILGGLLLLLALFYSAGVGALFRLFPPAVLGAILFLAGAELALAARPGGERRDVYVTLCTAGLAMWNMGAAFLAGIVLQAALARGWVRWQG